jgi:hypothetical protein
MCPRKVLVGVVEPWYQRTPVQDRPVLAPGGGAHEFQRVCRDVGGVRLDALVIDTRIGEQQCHLEIRKLIQQRDVARVHLVPGDDQHVIPQAAAVKIGQYRQRVRPDGRQERVCCTVEDL